VNHVGTGARKNTTALLLGFLILAGGCTASRVKSKEKSSPVKTLAVLSINQSSVDLSECVLKGMHRANRKLTFVDSQEFKDTFFPWFEPGTAPEKVDDLVLLLNKPLVQEKITQLGLRYVISVSGTTDVSSWDHDIEVGGYIIPIWGGHGTRYYLTTITTKIWDLEDPASSSNFSVWKSGNSYYFCLIIPLFYIPSTAESHACKEMGEKLVQFVTDNSVKE
jgi:hypothetical protein